MRRSILVCLIISLVSAPLANQAQSKMPVESPSAYIERIGNGLLTGLDIYETKPYSGADDLENFVRDQFATETISAFVLGSAWTKATRNQRADFKGAFETYMAWAFVKLLLTSRPKRLDVKSSIDQGRGGVLVRTSILDGRGHAKALDWRVVQESGREKLADVSLNGVSQLLTYRSEFKTVLASGGIDGLTRVLQARAH